MSRLITLIEKLELYADTKPKKILFDFFAFGLKQAYASLLLIGILASKFLWPENSPLARYDFLFIYALLIQTIFLRLKLETWNEVSVILIFHIVGTIMEIFKTHVGSWVYPEENFIRIEGVPLFSGFMYSAVGSYIARVWRIFDFSFQFYPKKSLTIILAVLIYVNFFTHHYFLDIRLALFAFTAYIFARTRICFTPHKTTYWMPLLLGFFLVSFFIWLAENVGTFGAIWVYPTQQKLWHMVPFEKMGSWFLLMLISFVLVTIIHKDKIRIK
jgi:uncharacterized membrane protein YoaT (DUF817 family)